MIPVGLTQRGEEYPDRGESRDALDVRWHVLLRACGLLAVPVPNDPELAVGHVEAFGCRGLILTGGGDLARDDTVPDRRERTERLVYAWARDSGRPVLGVCRGMQLLVTVAGGRLGEVAGHVATRHAIETLSGARIVNSFHRFAAVAAPPGYEVVARAGPVIEAIAHREHPVIGMMWHPERERPFDRADVELIRRLFCQVCPV